MPLFSEDDLAAWKHELSAMKPDDPGLTTMELASAAGIGRKTMQRKLEMGVASGKYIRGTAVRNNKNGHVIRVPVYTPKEK